MDFPPDRLTFSNWREFGDECHVHFFTLLKTERAPEHETILASLDYAVDLFENPKAHTQSPYGIGPDAYAHFIDAVKAGYGSSHGNWCRADAWRGGNLLRLFD